MNEELNKNDRILLSLCRDFPLSITRLSELMGIALKNVSVRVKKLEKMGLIKVTKGKGQTKKIIAKTKIKPEQSMARVLKILIDRGGELNESEFFALSSLFNEEEIDGGFYVLRGYPPLIDKIIRINETGKKFLKTHLKSYTKQK